MLLVEPGQELVQPGRLDPLPGVPVDLLGHVQDLDHPLAGQGGNEEERGITHELELGADEVPDFLGIDPFGRSTRSHLFRTRIRGLPDSWAMWAMWASWRVGKSRASRTRQMTSASRMFILALMMPAFSRESRPRLNFRIPAVSTRQNGFPSRRMIVSVLSRVVPGTSLTRSLSSPHSRLMIDDLPTLIRPTMAMRRGFLFTVGAHGGQERGDPLPELVDIDLMLGRERDDVPVPEPVEFGELVLVRSGSPPY